MKGMDEAVHAYCEHRHEKDRIAIRDCYEEMTSFLTIYADDITDITDTSKMSSDYCIGNICFYTKARKRLFDSVYPGFITFLEELVALKRVYVAQVEIICCLDAEVRYHTTAKKFTYYENMEGKAEESLGDWLTEYAIPGLRDWVEETGDDKCKALSPSLYLCDWIIVSSNAWEERA